MSAADYSEAELKAGKRAAHEAACEAYGKKLAEVLPKLRGRDLSGHGHRALALLILNGDPVLMKSDYEWDDDQELMVRLLKARSAGVT